MGAGQPVTEYYVYDGGEPGSAEQPDKDADPGQIVLRLDETGAPTYRYLWSDAVDHLLADEYVDDGSAGDIYWPLADHQNTVRDLVQYDTRDNEAEVVNHITYDSYGNVLSETRATDHIFGYTGKLFDEATGLQNNLNRWYDPEVGRWLSEDPIGFEGGDANLYRSCSNWAVNAIDPLGLGIWSWIWTGNFNPSDEEWDAAMAGAGQSYLNSAADAHNALDSLGGAGSGLGPAVSDTLALVEGDLLHDAVMNNQPPPAGAAGNNLPNLAPPPPALPPQQPQNAGQKFNREAAVWLPWLILAASYADHMEDWNEYNKIWEEIDENNAQFQEALEDLEHAEQWGNSFTQEEKADRLREIAREGLRLEERARNLEQRLVPPHNEN